MQDLMKGKRGLIMGVANDHSIAWGIAKALAAQGAELAFTYQGEALASGVKPLAQPLGVDSSCPAMSRTSHSVDLVFEALRAKWGQSGFSGSCHRLLRQERAEGPLCRHHAREFFAHHADLLLLVHRDSPSAPPN